jgi:hypothetical protein
VASEKQKYPDDLAFLDDEEDFLHGLDDVKFRRRRRTGGTAVGGGTIVLTPDPMTATDTTSPSTVIGTVSILGGFGTYTFTLTDPTGRFTINPTTGAISTVSPLTAGFYNVTINATNGSGDNPVYPTVIYVSHVGTYVPTYYLYGF